MSNFPNLNNFKKLIQRVTPKIYNSAIDDNRCDICLDDNNYNNDDLITCDGCNFVTHESCYGKKRFKFPFN